MVYIYLGLGDFKLPGSVGLAARLQMGNNGISIDELHHMASWSLQMYISAV